MRNSTDIEILERLQQLISKQMSVTKIRPPHPDTSAVIVLSAPHSELMKDPNDPTKGTYTLEQNEENTARTLVGLETWYRLKGARQNLPLVLNGDEQQLYALTNIAWGGSLVHDPVSPYLYALNCGSRGLANTRTQFEVMREGQARRIKNGQLYYIDFSRVAFVTTTYHVVRVAHTAYLQLDPKGQFEVIGAPNGYAGFKYDPAERLDWNHPKSEVRRIVEYAAKQPPDCALFLPPDLVHVYDQ